MDLRERQIAQQDEEDAALLKALCAFEPSSRGGFLDPRTDVSFSTHYSSVNASSAHEILSLIIPV